MKRVPIALGLVVVAAVAVWFTQELVLSFAVRTGLTWYLEKNGLEFRAESVRCGIGRPVVIEGMAIHEADRAVFGSLLEAGRVEIVPNTLWDIVAGGEALAGKIACSRVYALVDLREGGAARKRAAGKTGPWAFAAGMAGAWLGEPKKVVFTGTTVDVLSDVSRVVLEGIDGSFEKGRNGGVSCELAQVSIGSKSRSLGPLRANAAWNGRSLTLAGMEILPGLVLKEVDFRMPRLRDISVGFRAEAFGGSLRGDIDLRDAASGRIWDVAIVGAGIGLDGVVDAFELPVVGAKGRIDEARFTFRGEAGRPADAEASFRVLARDFEWNSQRCRSLEVATSLIQRRLIVSTLVFEQEGNTIRSNGEVSIAEGWQKIAESPFLVNIRAGISDPEALAKLLGLGFDGVKGRIDVGGSVSGRPGMLDGFLDARARGIVGRGVAAEQIDVELLFLKKRIELAVCSMVSGRDTLRGGGSIGIVGPNDYSAWVVARAEDVSKYSQMLPESLARIVSSGALDLEWKGEGDLARHTGTFGLSLGDFVSRWTPGGVTGRFDGGYTPGDVRIDTLALENGSLRFTAKAGMSRGGLGLKEMVLTANGKPLLEGATFLPIDLFGLGKGGHWSEAVHRGKALELRIGTPGKVELGELMRLAGQEYPVGGSLGMELDCWGLPEKLNGSASLTIDGFRYGNNGAPPVTIELRGDLKDGGLEGGGRLGAAGMDAVDARIRLAPFFYQQGAADGALVKESAAIEGGIVFPKFNLALLEPLLPSVSRLRGNLSGELSVHGLLGSPGLYGEAAVSDAAFSHRFATAATEGISGRVGFSDGVVSVQNLSGRIAGGTFRVSGTCRFDKPWEPEYGLDWVFERVPLFFSPGVVLPVSGRVAARGGAGSGALGGTLEIEPAGFGGRIAVRPRLSATPMVLPPWTLSLKSVARLAPSPDWDLGLSIGAKAPLALGGVFDGSFIDPHLFLGGTAGKPVLTGRVDFTGMRFETPGGPLFAAVGALYLLPDNPTDPFMLVESSGVVAGVEVGAVAWGALSEGKWLLETAAGDGPHAGFWLLARGMAPMPPVAGSLPPVDMRFYPNAAMVAQPVSLRVVEGSVWCGGVGLSESMDFGIGGNALPEQGYRPGFEWALSPQP